MKLTNIGGERSSPEYVRHKLDKLNKSDRSFETLYGMMFSERENVFWEQNDGYRIFKTTYGECHDSIEKLAAVLDTELASAGCPRGSAVGLHMENSLLWIEIFWAILRSGRNPLLMNLRLDSRSLSEAAADCGAKAVISDDGEARFGLPAFKASAFAAGSRCLEPGIFGSEFFVMSSGTSSHVKICSYNQESLYYQMQNSGTTIHGCPLLQKHYRGELKLLTFLPFYHIFGLFAVYFWFAFFSRTFVYLPDINPDTILGTVRKHEVTHIFAVPLFWEKVYEQATRTIKNRGDAVYGKFSRALKLSNSLGAFTPAWSAFSKLAFREVRDNMFGDSVCFMISGGSMIRPAVLEFFNGIGYHLSNGYGMTETGITSVETSTRPKVLNLCSVGKPMASVKYSVDGNGELTVSGTSLCSYIITDGVRTDTCGVFNTHDLAYEKSGRYYLTGRADDLIIAADGENLNPNIAEQLLDIPDSQGFCIIKGNPPVLIVSVNAVTCGGKLPAMREDITAKLAAAGLSKAAVKIEFVTDSLIGETDIKVNRTRIAAAYKEGRLHLLVPGQAKDARAVTELEKAVAERFAAVLGKDPTDIRTDADFFTDAGGTSIEYSSLIAVLGRDYDIAFPAETDKCPRTVRDICEYIGGGVRA